MTHREMMDRMSAAEFNEWIAFDRIEPIRSDAAAWQVASLELMYLNAHRDNEQRSTPYTLEEVKMFHTPAPAPKQTAEEQLSMAQMITGQFQSKVKPRK